MSNIFGKTNSRSDSHSYNANMGLVNGLYTPVAQQAGQAGNQLANLLGLNGGDGQNAAFDSWRNSTGYKFGLDQGTEAITGNAATQGILNSGATAKALQTYGQNYANTQYGNYFNQLSGLLGNGLQAGSLLANVGQKQDSTSMEGPKNGGIGAIAGNVLGMLLAG